MSTGDEMWVAFMMMLSCFTLLWCARMMWKQHRKIKDCEELFDALLKAKWDKLPNKETPDLPASIRRTFEGD
jgi:hypothetical protein